MLIKPRRALSVGCCNVGIIHSAGKTWQLRIQLFNIHVLEHTVPLKSKIPVSSHFSRDKSCISRFKILVSRDATLVPRYGNLVV